MSWTPPRIEPDGSLEGLSEDEEAAIRWGADRARVESADRIAQLEAALAERAAQYEYSAGVLAAVMVRLRSPEAEVLAPYLDHPLVEDVTAAALRLAERDAALAVAHEALERASSWVESNWQSAQWTRNRIQVITADECRREGDLLRSALSAPALQRAAEELRLLRELETLDRGCADTTEHFEALRRFREEKPDET